MVKTDRNQLKDFLTHQAKVMKLHVSKMLPNLLYYAPTYFFHIYVLQLILMSINEFLNLAKTHLSTEKIFRALQHDTCIRASLSAH